MKGGAASGPRADLSLVSASMLVAAWLSGLVVSGQEASIEVHAGQVAQHVSPYLTGACIEDVNHEIYGGLYSQMIFGESFQEQPMGVPPKGFKAFGGSWRVNEEAGILWASGDDGPKVVSEYPEFTNGEAGVEVWLSYGEGNAGLIVKVGNAGVGADNFDGYEVSLDASRQVLRLGRHRHNWEHIQDAPCEVPAWHWIPLVVEMTGPKLVVLVNGKRVIEYEDREHPLGAGTVGLRLWQRTASFGARFRRLWVKTGSAPVALPFERGSAENLEVMGMWRAMKRGSAAGGCALERDRPFTGKQSQRVVFVSGVGDFGIENQGLNRWGLNFIAGRPYEGYVWARAERPVELFAALESRDGAWVYAQTRLKVRPAQAPRAPDRGAQASSPAASRPPKDEAANQGGFLGSADGWQRLDFSLTPNATDKAGRFALKLKQPGSVLFGHVFLQPGEWGRFKGLPVRRDVAEALVAQGITVLRYGGSMVNHPEYRWKKMIGPRDRRPQYAGTWYPHSSNGWGILDFLNFCEAAGFLALPAFNLDETPPDMADFMEYVNGSAATEWGRKRAADGHPAPYGLRYLELGNEERVDDDYFRKFSALAEAIWARDPKVILVVGDFLYTEPIRDPFSFKGAASGITSLSAHQKILALAKARQREVWFDVHVGTEGPGRSAELLALPAYVEALKRVSDGARHQVVVFEFNAGNHQHRRALANALAIHAVERLGLPIATSANCLQPDGQNDNGWDQGLLFLNPSQVWLQPPGYVTRMVSRNYEPLLVRTEVHSPGDQLDVSAKRSEDGRTLVLQVVNLSDQPIPTPIRLEGFSPAKPVARVEELSGPLDAVNTAENPNHLAPQQTEWRHGFSAGAPRYSFPPHSFTILRIE